MGAVPTGLNSLHASEGCYLDLRTRSAARIEVQTRDSMSVEGREVGRKRTD